MARALARLFLALTGWRAMGELPPHRKYVLIAAPHTSNWDLPFMLAIRTMLGVRVSWMGKHTLFRAPFGWLFRWLGGVPVDRRGRHGAVGQMAAIFAERDDLVLAVAPEGTRSLTRHWKSGFYEIAREAGVPIVLGYLDYGNKRGGLGPVLEVTGDAVADMDRIREFYGTMTGQNPEQFGPIRLRSEIEAEASDEAQ